jgi:hypothetical protein
MSRTFRPRYATVTIELLNNGGGGTIAKFKSKLSLRWTRWFHDLSGFYYQKFSIPNLKRISSPYTGIA